MRIVTCDITADGADPLVGHLLADFAEALDVYARAYGHDEAPEIFSLNDGESDGDDLGGDVVILGAAAGRGAGAASVPEGARVYAVVTAPSIDGAEARPTTASLERACAGRGALWSGALVVGDEAWHLRWASAPRMGWRRRGTSEAVDRLIAAVRAGADFPSELVRPALPRRVLCALLDAIAPLARG